MKSYVTNIGTIDLPLITGHYSMIPFNLQTLEGLSDQFKEIAKQLLTGVVNKNGIGFFTIHGKRLTKGQTLRRGGPHTDGSYDKNILDWGKGGGNGWKIGENGPGLSTTDHHRLYNAESGGLILASNFEACNGWIGEYEGSPGVGGDCSKIKLDTPFLLQRNTIYYGNNHFIHESLPMSDNVHRVFTRITLPQNHQYLV